MSEEVITIDVSLGTGHGNVLDLLPPEWAERIKNMTSDDYIFKVPQKVWDDLRPHSLGAWKANMGYGPSTLARAPWSAVYHEDGSGRQALLIPSEVIFAGHRYWAIVYPES